MFLIITKLAVPAIGALAGFVLGFTMQVSETQMAVEEARFANEMQLLELEEELRRLEEEENEHDPDQEKPAE